eukprot:SM015027S01440  [mRNA]  locus=s15027:2:163:- [translate_table: standard]
MPPEADVDGGFNPALTVLLVVVGILLLFFIGNYVLYNYAQKVRLLPAASLPPYL